MNCKADETQPKYACRQCGSDEVRGGFDTFPVCQAEGDKLIYLRSECPDASVLALFCLQCNERIEVEDLGEIQIE